MRYIGLVLGWSLVGLGLWFVVWEVLFALSAARKRWPARQPLMN